MTSIVSPQRVPAAVRVPAPPRFSALRSAVADWTHAFRAAARSPRPEGMDPVALRTFGRA